MVHAENVLLVEDINTFPTITRTSHESGIYITHQLILSR